MKTHSESTQRKELKILRTIINEAIGKPYLYNDSVTISAQLNAVENEIDCRISDVEWFRRISGVVTSVSCGHTAIFPSGHLMTDFVSTRSSFPIEVALVEGKLYALGNYKNDKKQSIKKGMEIRSINGLTIPNVLKKMYPLFSSDAYNVSMKEAFFEDFFSFYYYLATANEESEEPEEFRIIFINEKRVEEEMILPKSFPSVTKLRAKFKKNPFVKPPKLTTFGVKKIEKQKGYGYLKFHSFAHLGGKKYEDWLRKFFIEFRNKELNYLILDLRGNLGGLPQNELLSYLIPKNNGFLTMTIPNLQKLSYRKYYKKWNKEYFSYHKMKKEAIKFKVENDSDFVYTYVTPDAYGSKMFKGKVLVLVDGLSFSSSANIVSNLRDHADVVVIGKTTGGSYQQGNTGQLQFKFPKSKYSVVLNPIYFNNTPQDTILFDKGIEPDIYVEAVFGNKKSNDLVLKAAEQYILEHVQLKAK